MTQAIERFPSNLPLPFSKVVRAGGFLFLSGQIAMDEAGKPIGGDIATQTHAVLRGIGSTLAEHGAGMQHVVRATVWLADLDDFAAFNAVYKEYFPAGYPTRSTVQAGLAMGAKVEIEVQAWLGARSSTG